MSPLKLTGIPASARSRPGLAHRVVLHLLDLEVPEDAVAGDRRQHRDGQRGADGDGGGLVPDGHLAVAVELGAEVVPLEHERLQLQRAQEELALDAVGEGVVRVGGQVEDRLRAGVGLARGRGDQHLAVGQLEGLAWGGRGQRS